MRKKKKIENSFLFKNIKKYNKYLLIVFAIVFISITGLTSYAVFTTEVESSNTIRLEVAPYNPEDWIWEFEYTGSYQKFTVPKTGYYETELWGAQGGWTGGKGAYIKGTIYLEKAEIIYIYVGQNNSTANGTSFNGGTGSAGGAPGGGATDIRYFATTPTSTELQWNNITGLRSRIMVAGGGGTGTPTVGGAGGDLNGGPALAGTTRGGSQIAGGAGADGYSNGSFGIGGNGCGGGGGYYGGGGAACATGAGGGSSFISGYAGSNAITSVSSSTATNNVKHYNGKYFINSYMQGGNNSGNGRGKITYIGTTAPVKINNKLNNVRYIKSCLNGSNVNTANHWVEIQTIKDGVNLAKGKTPTGTVTLASPTYSTTGNMYFTDYTTGGSDLQCLTIDLCNSYDLDEIALWLYWGDGRTYYDNTLSVGSTCDTTCLINKGSLVAFGGKYLHDFPGTIGYNEKSIGRRYTAWD